MKPKILIVVLFVGLVSQQWAASQTDTNSIATNEPAISTAPASLPAIIVAAPETTGTVANDTAMIPVADTNEFPGATSSSETASAGVPLTVSTNVLPVQFQDVPLTTAIENLARLAGINYLLDPQIAYGQPDQSGHIRTEPTISVRWENITAQQALMAVLSNYGLQLVENPKTKIARITIENTEKPPLITRVIQLKYSSVSNMQAAVESTLSDPFKRSKVISDSRTSQLVVVATEKEQDAVDTLIEQLDKPTRQVLIETRLMEVSSSPSTAKGINWAGTLSGQNVSIGNNALPGIPSTPATTIYDPTTGLPVSQTTASAGTLGGILPTTGSQLLGSLNRGSFFNPSQIFLNADGVKAVLSFLNQDSDAQVIATPRVVTLDNQTAHIEVTRAVPIFNSTAGTQGSPGGSTVTYSNLGTILDVTPRITANDYIWLSVQPEVSSVFDTVTKIVAGVENQADEYDVRKVTTQVLIPNANTLVMGGFIRDNTKNIYTKVPIMGDIPILGYAFRSESKGLEKDNLLIFITPTIIRDMDFQPTTTKFLQSNPLAPKPPMNPNKMWNSAKPRDWSSPKNTDPYLNVIDQNSTKFGSTITNGMVSP